MDVAKIVLELLELRYGLESNLRASAINLNGKRRPGADADNALHIGKAFDLLAIYRQYQVAWLEAGCLCGTSRLHGIDTRACDLFADGHENRSENRDCEEEICDRPGHNDRRARCNRLEDKTVFLFGLRHCSDRRITWRARRVVIAEKFHIATKRNRRNLPAGPIAVVKAGNLRPKPDREYKDSDAAPARHQEMAKLVKENDNREHEKKRHDVADEAPAEGTEAFHNFNSHFDPRLAPKGVSSPVSYLGCLCGNFGQEVPGDTSCSMVNGEGRVDSSWFCQ